MFDFRFSQRLIARSARQAARNKLSAVFKATAVSRFLLNGMYKAQADRDRRLRTKELNEVGLPTRSLTNLGYGVKGPKDILVKEIRRLIDTHIPEAGDFVDRLSGQPRESSHEGRAHYCNLRSVIERHLAVCASADMLRSDAGASVTVHFRTTDDSADLDRFSEFGLPIFSVSVQAVDDPAVFVRGWSNFITMPLLVLLAFERSTLDTTRYYGPHLRTQIAAACTAPFQLRSRNRTVSITIRYFGSCGDAKSQQANSGNACSSSEYRCWLCNTPTTRYSHCSTHPTSMQPTPLIVISYVNCHVCCVCVCAVGQTAICRLSKRRTPNRLFIT